MAIHALLEHITIAKVSDQATFQKNIQVFQDAGFIRSTRRAFLKQLWRRDTLRCRAPTNRPQTISSRFWLFSRQTMTGQSLVHSKFTSSALFLVQTSLHDGCCAGRNYKINPEKSPPENAAFLC
jgi:hypothetical protein